MDRWIDGWMYKVFHQALLVDLLDQITLIFETTEFVIDENNWSKHTMVLAVTFRYSCYSTANNAALS